MDTGASDMAAVPPVRGGPSTLSILRIFFKIGATAFGGQGAAVAVMQRELVDVVRDGRPARR